MENVELSIVKASDGKYCVTLNDYRIAGPKPALSTNNIVQTFRVSVADIARALDDDRGVHPKV